jgi:hypothetical protein
MCMIEDATKLVNAKEMMKRREEHDRNAAILRNINNEQLEQERFHNTILRGLLLVSLFGNVYVALIGWGVL